MSKGPLVLKKEMHVNKNEKFIEIAEGLKPKLINQKVVPKRLVEMVRDEQVIHGWKVIEAKNLESIHQKAFKKGDSFILDFGDHEVGFLTIKVRPVGSPPDAPLRLKLIFGEMPCEMAEPFSEYNGWISSSWLQEEIINVDVLPAELHLPRRYCFRYLKVEILATSLKYEVSFDEIYCTTVTSGNVDLIDELPLSIDQELREIDRVSIKTLQDCMQDVFEDGPKRDRRLWIGDLRLQAIANYQTIKNYDLVKRCLYLFAGLRNDDGKVSACFFIEPELMPDDTFLYDYALFFVDCLYGYYDATKDKAVLNDLWEVAFRQIELALERLDDRNIVMDDDSWWSFIDWHEDLNKQAPSQAVLIYSLKRALTLAVELESKEINFLRGQIEVLSRATMKHLWDEEKGFLISGEEKSISWASQVWMVLAQIMTQEDNARLLKRLLEEQPAIKLSTPYAYHHLIEALFVSNLKELAVSQIKAYWGEMIKDGADTFWELYNPEDKMYSPYGSNLINSYCHAWSCTPTYFIREYLC